MYKVDISTYSQQDTERIPCIWEYRSEAGNISYTVHRHIYNPNTWFLKCRGYCDMVDLDTNNFAEAEKRAASYMKELAQRKIQEFTLLIEDIEKEYKL